MSIKRVSTVEIYANPWLSLREDGIVRADGSPGIYSVVDKPAGVIVIPRDRERLYLVEQFRYAVGARRWEFPAGTAPHRQSVPATELAVRELSEETGLLAGSLTQIGAVDVAPGFSSQGLGQEDRPRENTKSRTWRLAGGPSTRCGPRSRQETSVTHRRSPHSRCSLPTTRVAAKTRPPPA